MKNRFLAVCLVSVMLAFTATGCGGSGSGTEEDTTAESAEKEYVDEDQIDDVFANADDFQGKYITLAGKVCDNPSKDDEKTAIEIYHDVKNSDQGFIVYVKHLKDDVEADDYVEVDGAILGKQGEDASLDRTWIYDEDAPLIQASTVTKSDYIDVVVPTLKTLNVEDTQEQNDCTITLKKVEYAETETRIYLEAKNSSDDEVDFNTYGMRIIQDGKQIEENDENSSAYLGNYEELSSSLTAGASSTGVIVFPAIDQDLDFQLIVPDTFSENWEINFEDYTFDVSATEESE